MSDDPEDHDQDRELSRWLRAGADPLPPARLDARVAESYRRRGRGWPARVWGARLSLPAPVAALLLVALLTAGALARDIRWPRFDRTPAASSGLAGLRPLAEVQIRVAAKETR